jgi:hypothetical protein
MKLNTKNATAIMEAGSMEIPAAIYRGAGRAWVAIRDGELVAIEYMHAYPTVSLADLGRKRMTKAARLAIKAAENQNFAQHRTDARARLANLGTVVSGTASGGVFYPKEVEFRAMATNLSETGNPYGVSI